MRILVTGGAGFIGSSTVKKLISLGHDVINVDKLTYAGNLESLADVCDEPNYHFEQADICDIEAIRSLFNDYSPNKIMHLAAESHVDRSIDGPDGFVHTNIVGTSNLLEVSRAYYKHLPVDERDEFRFHHVSTDEVYGDLGDLDSPFSEETPYSPNSPYAASKASADHLVRAWFRTYKLPILITNCSNNFGPFQYPEKLIPVVILNALAGKELPIYGSGSQVRDWLFVEDHADALVNVMFNGVVGETYNIGGDSERTNLEVVQSICSMLDVIRPDHPNEISSYSDLITHVNDRPGHDQRYAIDATKIHNQIGWKPQETFESGLQKTVEWYINNPAWCRHVQEDSYHGERLGLGDMG